MQLVNPFDEPGEHVGEAKAVAAQTLEAAAYTAHTLMGGWNFAPWAVPHFWQRQVSATNKREITGCFSRLSPEPAALCRRVQAICVGTPARRSSLKRY
jgi:hypothetical protein